MYSTTGEEIGCQEVPSHLLYKFLGNMPITRRELFEVWTSGNNISHKNLIVINYVFDSLGLNINERRGKYKNISQIVKPLCSHFQKKWVDAKRTKKVMEVRNSEWLDKVIDFSTEQEEEILNSNCNLVQNRGRPPKTFSQSSNSSQVKKISTIVQSASRDELLVATRVSLYKAGKRDAAQVLGGIEKSPTRASKLKKTLSCPQVTPTSYTPEEALALYVDGRYTKNSYIRMQSGAKSKDANIYPPYNVLL